MSRQVSIRSEQEVISLTTRNTKHRRLFSKDSSKGGWGWVEVAFGDIYLSSIICFIVSICIVRHKVAANCTYYRDLTHVLGS